MVHNQELALPKMRESVQRLGSSTERYGDPTLMRFLIARSSDTEKAANMFLQWQKWRASFVPLDYIPDSEVEDELSGEKIYLQGLSTEGNPVLIVKASKHFPSKDQLQFKKMPDLLRIGHPKPVPKAKGLFRSHLENLQDESREKFVAHILDKVIASSFRGKEIGNEQLIAILDLQKISYKNIDARGLVTGFQFLQAYYPERLAKLYMLHMPEFFVRIWRFVSRFLEKATQEKLGTRTTKKGVFESVVIVTNEEERREFIRGIGEEALPEEYGGQARLVLLQDFQLKPLDH
ncbi:hypothetical protein OROHE_023247 [Orobanche hederae]